MEIFQRRYGDPYDENFVDEYFYANIKSVHVYESVDKVIQDIFTALHVHWMVENIKITKSRMNNNQIYGLNGIVYLHLCEVSGLTQDSIDFIK